MSTPDAAYFHKQAKKCRWLASQSDAGLAQTLLAQAEEYEAKALELEGITAAMPIEIPPPAQ